jgi:hypothetical protein
MAADPFSEIKKAKEEAKKRREGKIIKTNSVNMELEKAKAQNKTSRRVKDSLKLEQEKALSKTDKFKKTNPAFKELEKAKREANIRRYKRTQPEVKAKPAPKPAPKKAAPKAERAKGSEGFKPTKTDIGPNMNKVNKPDAKADTRSTMEKLFGVSEERRQMGRDLQKKAQASMGFKHGGNVKKMKHGGSVKSHRGDGICKKGKTRGRMV